jgi:hypothetical protein
MYKKSTVTSVDKVSSQQMCNRGRDFSWGTKWGFYSVRMREEQIYNFVSRVRNHFSLLHYILRSMNTFNNLHFVSLFHNVIFSIKIFRESWTFIIYDTYLGLDNVSKIHKTCTTKSISRHRSRAMQQCQELTESADGRKSTTKTHVSDIVEDYAKKWWSQCSPFSERKIAILVSPESSSRTRNDRNVIKSFVSMTTWSCRLSIEFNMSIFL